MVEEEREISYMRTSRLLAAVAWAALASAADNTLSTDAQRAWNNIKNNLQKSAEKMPEADYSFRPVDSVRSYGAIVGHVADTHYAVCGAAKGESKETDIENTKKTKADLVAALKDSISYCDGAYGGL